MTIDHPAVAAVPILALKGAGIVGAMVLAVVDPAWAVPLQTLLIIVLTIISGRNRVTVKETQATVDATHVKVEETHGAVLKAKANATHAASAAAAAAATAASAAKIAENSQRILQDIGGALRSTSAPPIPEEAEKP